MVKSKLLSSIGLCVLLIGTGFISNKAFEIYFTRKNQSVKPVSIKDVTVNDTNTKDKAEALADKLVEELAKKENESNNKLKDTEEEKLNEVSIGKISGHVYITLGSGESNILRGLEIVLSKATPIFIEKLSKVKAHESKILDMVEDVTKKNYRWIEELQKKPLLERGSLNLRKDIPIKLDELSTLGGLIKRYEILSYAFFHNYADYTTRTNFEGKFEFKDLQQGKYYIYAKYETVLDAGYWLIGVEILQDESLIEIDLSNHNLLDLKTKMRIEEIKWEEEILSEDRAFLKLESLELQIKSLHNKNSIAEGEKDSELFKDFPQ